MACHFFFLIWGYQRCPFVYRAAAREAFGFSSQCAPTMCAMIVWPDGFVIFPVFGMVATPFTN